MANEFSTIILSHNAYISTIGVEAAFKYRERILITIPLHVASCVIDWSGQMELISNTNFKLTSSYEII